MFGPYLGSRRRSPVPRGTGDGWSVAIVRDGEGGVSSFIVRHWRGRLPFIGGYTVERVGRKDVRFVRTYRDLVNFIDPIPCDEE